MTQLSCVLGVVGLLGATATARVTFAEQTLLLREQSPNDDYLAAQDIARRWARLYGAFKPEQIQEGDHEFAKEVAAYFAEASRLIDQGYKVGAWKELLNEKSGASIVKDKHIHFADGVSRRGPWLDKQFMMGYVRSLGKGAALEEELEGARQRRLLEVLLGLLAPHFIALSLAIALTKSSATIRGFAVEGE